MLANQNLLHLVFKWLVNKKNSGEVAVWQALFDAQRYGAKTTTNSPHARWHIHALPLLFHGLATAPDRRTVDRRVAPCDSPMLRPEQVKGCRRQIRDGPPICVLLQHEQARPAMVGGVEGAQHERRLAVRRRQNPTRWRRVDPSALVVIAADQRDLELGMRSGTRMWRRAPARDPPPRAASEARAPGAAARAPRRVSSRHCHPPASQRRARPAPRRTEAGWHGVACVAFQCSRGSTNDPMRHPHCAGPWGGAHLIALF
jgi:hypothetical protein